MQSWIKLLKKLDEMGIWRLNFRPSKLHDDRIICYGYCFYNNDLNKRIGVIFKVNGRIETTYEIRTKELRKQLHRKRSWTRVIKECGLKQAVDYFYLEEPLMLGQPTGLPKEINDYLTKHGFNIRSVITFNSKYAVNCKLCKATFKQIPLMIVIDI